MINNGGYQSVFPVTTGRTETKLEAEGTDFKMYQPIQIREISPLKISFTQLKFKGKGIKKFLLLKVTWHLKNLLEYTIKIAKTQKELQ